ncbi:MAG: ATP-dependent DNA helicase RecG [Chloroflexi bacterium]|nr:ATP-dependent DNA helicase RecG [Chloroflexota bacterium]
MTNPFLQLYKILELEKTRHYHNDAVLGGFESFASQWHPSALAIAATPAQKAWVEKTATKLAAYPQLSPSARPQAIQQLITSLSQLNTSAAPAAPRVVAPRPRPQPRPTPPPAATGLNAPLTTLHGIGPRLAKTLARLNLRQIDDLLWHLPVRYLDYSRLQTISQLRQGEQVTIRATVWGLKSRRTRNNRTLTTAVLTDATGTINATFWNPYIQRSLRPEHAYFFSGKVGITLGKRVLESPEFEPISDDPTHTARIVPIYPLTEGLSARVLRKHIRAVVETWAPRLPDPLPPEMRQRLGYPPLGDALRQVHFPDTAASLEQARKRLAFDELLIIQLGVLSQHRAWQQLPAQPLLLDDGALDDFLHILPFQLTAAQQRVLADIRRDIRRPYPMTRLLQGDVGSGKTVIAAAAMWAAVGNGAQAAIMAPTEILAEQHTRKLQDLFAQLLHPRKNWPLRLDLLTSSVTGQQRQAVLDALASGNTDILIGTHALIQENVHFHNLALIVVDEQHRFGVRQRTALRDKGASLNTAGTNTPHTLVMSATPIPRTLALTIYGDMDVSAIDELPPGRQPIKTYWIKADARTRVYQFIRDQIKAGRQAFIIYPLVDESEHLENVKAAIAEHKRLQSKVFPRLKVGLLHGRLAGKEKDAIMRAFADGEYHILVSTAVVEVGIDIPNASVMLIENADRFGLAQLHQFRGRVGRGSHASYCILVSNPKSDEANERMRAMENSTDGFELAEIDLRMRGPGEFFGTRQSGLPDLRLAQLSDARLLEAARREAETLLDHDPDLTQPPHQLLGQRTAEFWSQKNELS